ncbi:MAG TPA: lysophospholipid acyltransferase family protein [Bryobacteraceae bacterium]|jgi:1-acyl-sn-glycerol-3-phosphate acyltransferase
MAVLRALILTDPYIVVSTVFFATISFIVSLFDSVGNAQIAVARVWARMILFVAGVRVTAVGVDKLDPGGSYVIASNHSSYMDTPVILSSIPVQFRFLAKSGLFKVPFMGSHLKRAGHIPVPREDPRAAVKTMTEAARNIREKGISMLIFPEGGRTPDGELKPFKEGGAYIAIKAGVPIIPVAISGTRAVVPIHSGIVKAGKVTIRVGEPVATANLTLKDRERVTEQVRQQIASMLDGLN